MSFVFLNFNIGIEMKNKFYPPYNVWWTGTRGQSLSPKLPTHDDGFWCLWRVLLNTEYYLQM